MVSPGFNYLSFVAYYHMAYGKRLLSFGRSSTARVKLFSMLHHLSMFNIFAFLLYIDPYCIVECEVMLCFFFCYQCLLCVLQYGTADELLCEESERIVFC
jgi:hypothetical protein